MPADPSIAALQTVLERIERHADHWTLLGVTRASTLTQIAAAHRELSVLLHPDRAAFRKEGRGDDATRAFAAVSQAFNTLRNPERLAAYKQERINQQLGAQPGNKARGPSPENALRDVQRAMSKQDWSAAEQRIHKLRKSGVDLPPSELELLLGWAVFNNERHPHEVRSTAAKTIWNRVVQRERGGPYYVQATYYLAMAYRMDGEPTRSLGWVELCLKADPDHVDALRLKRLLSRPAKASKTEESTFFGRVAKSSGGFLKRLLAKKTA